jgi:CheY-like chemotaxis protein
MILNLSVNARDAMPDGGHLTITTSNVEMDVISAQQRGVAPGAYVVLEVSDTGIGIDSETQKHLFEPFFTTKDQGKGTGLGLSTVYGIARQSGGHIRLDSEPGKGATCRVYLPRVEQAQEVLARGVSGQREGAAVARDDAQGGDRTEARQRRETVLLVEDAKRVRQVVREILEMNGYQVLEARHGAEALKLSARHQGPIHLMVTDVVMPEMSGRELAQRLMPLRPDMRVLYMSGYTTDDAIVRHGVLDSGIAFIAKPFTPDGLAAKVRDVLDSPAGSAVAARLAKEVGAPRPGD